MNHGIINDSPWVEWADESMEQWITESRNQWFSDSISHWINESLDQRSNESMAQRISKSRNQSMNYWSTESTNFASLISPKVLRSPDFLLLVCLKNMQIELSRYSLVRILPTSSSKSTPNMTFFRHFEVQTESTELPLQSGAHFADLISQKCSEHIIFFGHFEMQIELSLLCTFCRQLCQIESRNRGNRDPTSAIPGATLPQKMQGFAPESVFTREFTRFWSVIYTSQLCDDGWLTWWCGQHDGVNANHDHRP